MGKGMVLGFGSGHPLPPSPILTYLDAGPKMEEEGEEGKFVALMYIYDT